MKTRIVSFCVICFALLTIGLNYFTFVRQYIITKDNVNTKLYYPGFTCFDKHAGELREMLLRNPIDKDSIYLLTKENDNLESVERAVAQIVQWDCMPHALNLGSIENVNGSEWVVKPYTYYYEGNYTNKL